MTPAELLSVGLVSVLVSVLTGGVVLVSVLAGGVVLVSLLELVEIRAEGGIFPVASRSLF